MIEHQFGDIAIDADARARGQKVRRRSWKCHVGISRPRASSSGRGAAELPNLADDDTKANRQQVRMLALRQDVYR